MDTKEIIIYSDNTGNVKVEAFVKDETIWLIQSQMVGLFQSSKANISEYIKHIFEEGELSQDATVRKFRTVRKEGNREVSREIDFYNLDMIIAVGYRVNSKQATKFRIWATKVLKEFIIKGFVLDDDRLKQAKSVFSKDKFIQKIEKK